MTQLLNRIPMSARLHSILSPHRSNPPTLVEEGASNAPVSTSLHPFQSHKKRGAWKWSDLLMAFYLPRYDGPYNVGTLTLELPIPESVPNQAHNPLRLKDPPNHSAFELTNSLITIYYPTQSTQSASPRLIWITLFQIKGYLKFAGLSFFKRLIALPLALLAIGRTKIPTSGSAPIAPLSSTSKRPLVLFSHGLIGSKTCYSQYCGQLAARGYVVAAIEHRDRSGSHSVINSKPPVQLNYIDMDDLDDETRPKDYLIARAYQLELRILELLAASQLLSSLSTPEGCKSIKHSNLRTKGSLGYMGDDGMKWDDAEWARFGSLVNWNSDVVLAGHSFGSATVFAAARHPARHDHWSKLIMLDPWLETLDFWPTTAPMLAPASSIHHPMLVINSPGFTVWSSHFEPLLKTLCARKDHPTWFFTIGGIIHSSFSDLPILFERLWRIRGQLKFDSQQALDLIVRGSIEFVTNEPHDVLGPQHITKGSEGIREVSPGTLVFHVQPLTDGQPQEKA